MNRERFSFYNKGTRAIMLFVMIPLFLFLTALFVSTQNSFLSMIAFFFFILLLVFVYKTCFIHVVIDEKGIRYKSLFKEKYIAKKELLDVLIVQKQRRNEPMYVSFKDFYEKGLYGGSSFLVFRTTNELPKSNAFVFSNPIDSFYISVQYRSDLEPWVLRLITE